MIHHRQILLTRNSKYILYAFLFQTLDQKVCGISLLLLHYDLLLHQLNQINQIEKEKKATAEFVSGFTPSHSAIASLLFSFDSLMYYFLMCFYLSPNIHRSTNNFQHHFSCKFHNLFLVEI